MTNREYLLKTAEFDVLVQMNKGLERVSQDDAACIMDCFMNEKELAKRCKAQCEKCIAAWLNEERK